MAKRKPAIHGSLLVMIYSYSSCHSPARFSLSPFSPAHCSFFCCFHRRAQHAGVLLWLWVRASVSVLPGRSCKTSLHLGPTYKHMKNMHINCALYSSDCCYDLTSSTSGMFCWLPPVDVYINISDPLRLVQYTAANCRGSHYEFRLNRTQGGLV